MLSEVVDACQRTTGAQPFRVLVVGLGGGAMPMYIRRHCTSATVESVELDARVASIAQRLLGFEADHRNAVEVADALGALQRRAASATPRYDRLIVDCFGGGRVPFACRSPAFIR